MAIREVDKEVQDNIDYKSAKKNAGKKTIKKVDVFNLKIF